MIQKWLTLMMLQKKAWKNRPHPNWLQISNHPYRILIIGDSGSGKTNSLFNLTSHQPDIHKTYFYGKDPYEAKYLFVINKQ